MRRDGSAATDIAEGKQSGLIPFTPGISGNPKGRPKGSRNKLSEAFLAALLADFQEHGAEVIQSVRADKPDQYLKVIAAVLPKEMQLNASPMADDKHSETDWTTEELRAFLRQNGGLGDARTQ